jgi:hypothetical protein
MLRGVWTELIYVGIDSSEKDILHGSKFLGPRERGEFIDYWEAAGFSKLQVSWHQIALRVVRR